MKCITIPFVLYIIFDMISLSINYICVCIGNIALNMTVVYFILIGEGGRKAELNNVVASY